MSVVIMWLAVIFAVVAIAVSLIVVYINRRKTRGVMEDLNAMLDSAIGGTFSESSFDESLQSAVETRLAEYLARSVSTEKNLKEEKDRIKELVGDISHQTKTPVSNIMLYGQLLQEQELEGEAMIAVNSLNEQAEKLSFLIQSLVKTSRLETGIFTLNKKRAGIRLVVEGAVSQAAPQAAKKSITIIAEDSDAEAVFDVKWTTEALYNVIDNAVKYTAAGGKVEILTEKYEMYCRISVRDTGIGITLEEQNKIFSRFYRSSTVADEKGVGIGLYLTRQILFAEDGYIKVQSQPGKGSVFSVYLPVS